MNTEHQEIKKFLKTGILFCLPLILFFGLSFLALWTSGELASLDQMVKIQQSSPSSLVGLAYSDPLRYLKLQTVLTKKPEIIMLGSSHTAYFRSAFFSSPNIFYNASVGGAYPPDFRVLLNRLPRQEQPKIIFIGLDPAWFDTVCNWQDYDFLDGQYTAEYNQANPFRAWQFGYIRLYQDYWAGRFSLGDLPKIFHTSDHFGLNARINQSGYRRDGTPIDTKQISRRVAETDEEFQKRTVTDYFSQYPERKQKCEEKFSQTVSEIKKFLSQSRSREIHVIGYVTPYNNTVYQELRQKGEKYEHIFRLAAVLKPVFDQFGFKVYDFSNLAKVNIPDQEMLDEVHTSEKASLRLFLIMRVREPKLWPYTDPAYLKKRLKEATSHLFVFDENEF